MVLQLCKSAFSLCFSIIFIYKKNFQRFTHLNDIFLLFNLLLAPWAASIYHTFSFLSLLALSTTTMDILIFGKVRWPERIWEFHWFFGWLDLCFKYLEYKNFLKLWIVFVLKNLGYTNLYASMYSMFKKHIFLWFSLKLPNHTKLDHKFTFWYALVLVVLIVSLSLWSRQTKPSLVWVSYQNVLYFAQIDKNLWPWIAIV